MVLDEKILETLRCPVRRLPLALMTDQELDRLNAAIAQGIATHASGATVTEPLANGLAAADGSSVYRVDDGVPILLPELRIVTSPDGPSPSDLAADSNASGLVELWEKWSEKWLGFKPPARPAPEDVALFERFVDEACAQTPPPGPGALLLGVTPEIATMHWPQSTRLLAIDFSEAMIRRVWPRHAVSNAAVARANWRSMPLADASYDVAIGDGILLWQTFPEDVVALAAEVRRVLKDNGAFVMRLFARPERQEPIEAVFDDLRRGRIPNSAALHLRIGMALHGDLRSGVRLGDAYDAWHANVPNEDVLLPSLGWPHETVGTFEVYRGLDTRVAYPTVAELTDLLAPNFRLTDCRIPASDTHGMFPALAFRATP